MKKFDFVAYAKYILISVLVVIVAGLTVMGIFGFNKSYDYKNGYEVRVSADEIFGEKGKEIVDITKDFFSKNDINVIAVRKIDDERIVSYIVDKKLTDGQKTALQERLDNDFQTLEIEINSNEKAVYNSISNIWWTLLASSILVVVACVYVGFRYKWVQSLVLLCTSIIEVLLLIALTAGTRIVVTAAYLPIVVASLAITILYSINYFALINQSRKNVANNGLSPKEFANKATNKNMTIILSVLLAVAIFTVMIMIFGSSALLRWVGIQILFAGIVASFTALFITGSLYSLFKRK